MNVIDRLPDARLESEEWQRLAAAERRLLLLDFDGTLAPFEIDRAAVRAVPGALASVHRIVTDGLAVAGFVSGRPLDELTGLTERLAVPLIGEHGWEERLEHGEHVVHPLSASTIELLDLAADRVGGLVDTNQLERKRTSIAVHTRTLSVPAAELLLEEVGNRWRDLGRRAEVRLHRFDGGCELRAAGHTKGTAVDSIQRRLGGCPLTVYIGDDETDEDAFRALTGTGFGIAVGRNGRATSARAMLPDVFAVAEYIALWLERIPPARETGSP